MRLEARRARLYESVRTAHLERAHELADAAIVYRVRRYDFDDDLAVGLELVHAGPVSAALLLRRSRLEILEINEPLMASSLPATAMALFAVRFGRRHPPRVVTYAIGNADPFAAPAPTWKRRVRWTIERALARYVWNRVDAIVYGTDGAREVYRSILPRRDDLAQTLIPALPARARRDAEAEARGQRVVFLGAFVQRKGIRLLMKAWPHVVRARPRATLAVVGKGALLGEIEAFARDDPSVSVVVDPPRGLIREVLASSLVLVLPSQPSPTWREQVGLPIVEALEQGCAVVTTSETGLAPWLEGHGHSVVPADADERALARAIVAQLDAGDRSCAISASLPDRDGRLAADEWLMTESGSER